MGTRPRAITALGWIFLAIGLVGLLRALLPLLKAAGSDHSFAAPAQQTMNASVILASALFAILGGASILRGANWGRWLLAAWIACHLVVGALHSLLELAVHGLLAIVALYLLFRQSSAAYFRDSAARRSRTA